MLAYLVLAGRNGRPVDPEMLQRFEHDDPLSVPFVPEERFVWKSRNGNIVVLGWQALTDVAGIGSHWVVSDRGLTAFSGHCWPAGTGWVHGSDRSWAHQLRDWLESRRDIPELREALFGHFTLISLDPDGSGWILPDFASIDQLFTAEDSNVIAVSNRAGLCAHAVNHPSSTPERSLMGAGWLICDGWILDEETGFWDVQRPRTGSYVTVDPRTGVRVVEPSRPPFFAPATDPAPLPYDELLEEVDHDLRSSIRDIARLPIEDRVLSLSGGKDSRTVAAIILSEGLQDRFRFVTHGSPERADVLAAGQIARRFGLEWSTTDASAQSPEAEMESVRQHVALSEGLNSNWSSHTSPIFEPGVTVSGVLGEALRWGPVSMTGVGVPDVEELIRRIDRKRPVDRLGVLRPEHRSYYREIRGELIRGLAAFGEPMGTVSTVSYHEGLAQSRNGPDYAWSPRMRLNPFLTPACMRASHRLPPEQRPNIRFHLDLQRRCDIGLSKLPFADSAWSEASFEHLPDADDYRHIQPVFSSSPDGRTWRVKRYADYRPVLEHYLLDRDNPIHALLDEQRLLERIATGDANAGRTRLIWSVLSAAVWMGKHELPFRFERPMSTPRLTI